MNGTVLGLTLDVLVLGPYGLSSSFLGLKYMHVGLFVSR